MTEDKAKRELARMRVQLRQWLAFRKRIDEIIAGVRPSKISPEAMRARMLQERAGEQQLADTLHQLLTEARGGIALPRPDLSKDPNAVVRLARAALGEQSLSVAQPTPQGILPLVILTVGGAVVLVAAHFIRTQAEVQMEKERLACIQAGACTDYGFWLKSAGIVGLAWFAWEKLGLKKALS